MADNLEKNLQNEENSEKKKRFWWLKLREGYFDTPALRKLLKVAGGETLTIIYLKMQLTSLKNDGVLIFEGYEDTFTDELAFVLNEDRDNVEVTLTVLQKYKLLEVINEKEYLLPEAIENSGSESDSAHRVRKLRQKRALQCNDDV